MRTAAGSSFAVILRSPSSRISPGMIATNAAALVVAELHGLPALRLLGVDLNGLQAGRPGHLGVGCQRHERLAGRVFGRWHPSPRQAPQSPSSETSTAIAKTCTMRRSACRKATRGPLNGTRAGWAVQRSG